MYVLIDIDETIIYTNIIPLLWHRLIWTYFKKWYVRRMFFFFFFLHFLKANFLDKG